MTEETSLRCLAAIVQAWATSQPEIARVFFFGSRIKGTATPTSDLDIAVSLNFEESGTSLAYWIHHCNHWAGELKALVSVEVDLQWYGGSETPTIHAALNDASFLVYDRANTCMLAP